MRLGIGLPKGSARGRGGLPRPRDGRQAELRLVGPADDARGRRRHRAGAGYEEAGLDVLAVFPRVPSLEHDWLADEALPAYAAAPSPA